MNEDPGSTNGPATKSWWDRLGHLFSGEPRSRDDLLEELRNAQSNGLLSSDTLGMVEGALKVTELDVDDVMIPRVQMVMIPANAPLTDIIDTVVESGHSRFPVHGEDKDDILGILLAKDLLKHFGDGEDFDIRKLLRPAVLIPDSMHLNVLLAELRLSHNHMALVVDEYGGVAGLVTIEDILEEIVGEIDDEHDDEEPPVMIQQLPEGGYLVSALTPIGEFNNTVGTDFSDEEFDTIGGMITSEFGHLPDTGEETELDGLLFHVTQSDDRRVHQFRVQPQTAETE
jgi:magnesium and cobalt transporter